jgi:hypothetical protein
MSEGYCRSREIQILLAERWVMTLQERGAGWGIHPADLVDQIVMLIEAKDLLDEVKSGGGAAIEAKCDEVIFDMARKAGAIKKQYLSAPSRSEE